MSLVQKAELQKVKTKKETTKAKINFQVKREKCPSNITNWIKKNIGPYYGFRSRWQNGEVITFLLRISPKWENVEKFIASDRAHEHELLRMARYPAKIDKSNHLKWKLFTAVRVGEELSRKKDQV